MKLISGRAWCWILYDFANTIFALNILSLYFALWVTSDLPGGEYLYAPAFSLSMVAVALASPVLGNLADRMGNKKFLVLFTLLCVGATAILPLSWGALSALALFIVANFSYQIGLVFYNSLLPAVSTPENRGRVSGLGVSLGYAGAIFGMYLVYPFVEPGVYQKLPEWLRAVIGSLSVQDLTLKTGPLRINAFLPSALLFLVFALPLFTGVREPLRDRVRPDRAPVLKEIWATLRALPGQRDLALFLLANFLYEDVIHTVILVMAIYAEKAIGFSSQGAINLLIAISTVAAILASYVWGWLCDRRPLKGVMLWVLGVWMGALILALGITSQREFYAVGVLAGVGLGGVWVVSRLCLLALAPRERIGEYFGLYGVTGKVAAVVGPLVWSGVLLLFSYREDLKYRAAIAALLVLLGAALAIFSRVRIPEARRCQTP
ncbi:MAG: MFS transporter [Candidatus Tectomicrobia bacterium]|uniref:MFS transporter n=1 Tax=Tectimicrobiota bacterium TaxID=2528274 RepID=A0A932GN82_UNCTE|nr:MFS transporter [Candidatus Tectomicrobia bacterium]